MTTTIVVKANHGWPVHVTPVNPKTGELGDTARVPAGGEQTFCVHSTQDLLVHEVQPEEVMTSTNATGT